MGELSLWSAVKCPAPGCRSLLVALALPLCGCAAGDVTILSEYRSMVFAGRARVGLHAGVDFGVPEGTPVLAAADGEVAALAYSGGCGYGVSLAHREFSRFTVYCHLEKYTVQTGQRVKRGDTLGHVGMTGFTGGIPHVHLELCTSFCPLGHPDGKLEFTENPLAITVGCFEPQKAYPADRLVLTYPVPCRKPEPSRTRAVK